MFRLFQPWFNPIHSTTLLRVIAVSFLVIISCYPKFAFSAITTYEAESGTLTGTFTTTAAGGYTGSGYVTGFDAVNDAVTVTVNVPTSGNYRIYIRYRSAFGDKTQDLYVNGAFVTNVLLPGSAGFTTVLTTSVMNAGNNTVSIRNNWGYSDIDNFGIEPVPSNVYNITPNLINAASDAKTKALYNLLRSQYGHCIFTGQTGYWDELIAITGKSPAVRGFDLQNYSPMNPWGWSGCCAAWGGWDDGTVQQAIDWYYSTGGKGIVTVHWHWFSPSGGTIRTSTFYTNSTNFDVSRVVPGNQEYTDVLRDIDAIAIQLKRLQTAGVPVLWRPLHEAGGAWFWWGAKGAAACKSLYDLMYTRLTNYHGLNNLIWVWSSPEPAWYPGNTKVDIIGYDSYPGAYNYSTQKSMFDQLNTIVGGQKLVALTENGPIPNINQAFADDAPWSYFMSWVDLVTQQNSNAHIIDSYNQACTLADVVALPVTWVDFTGRKSMDKVELNWSTSYESKNAFFEIERSLDGSSFVKVGRVEGAGSKNGITNYSFFDYPPSSQKVYYRLKNIDFDGASSYSKVILLEMNVSMELELFPNPCTGNFTIRSSTEIEAASLYTLEGVRVKSFQVPIHSTNINTSIHELENGMYMVEIKTNDSVVMKKIIKQD